MTIFYALYSNTTLQFSMKECQDMVVKDTYLLPLITYTRSDLHDKVERRVFFNLQNIIKGRLSKESTKTTSLSSRPLVHISSLHSLRAATTKNVFGWVWHRDRNGLNDLQLITLVCRKRNFLRVWCKYAKYFLLLAVDIES